MSDVISTHLAKPTTSANDALLVLKAMDAAYC
jgi:hypothetical protein